jgi:hypothetical protein
LYPSFIDVDPSEQWNPEEQPCYQDRFNDWTGIDSLVAPGVALICFSAIQTIENRALKRPLFTFPGGTGYDKDCQNDKEVEGLDDPVETEKEEWTQ